MCAQTGEHQGGGEAGSKIIYFSPPDFLHAHAVHSLILVFEIFALKKGCKQSI